MVELLRFKWIKVRHITRVDKITSCYFYCVCSLVRREKSFALYVVCIRPLECKYLYVIMNLSYFLCF